MSKRTYETFSNDAKVIDTNTDFTDPFLGMDEKEIINTDEFISVLPYRITILL